MSYNRNSDEALGKLLPVRFNGREYVTDDELVSIYVCSDKSWRVSYYPFADKDRGLTEKQAFDLARKRHSEALEILAS